MKWWKVVILSGIRASRQLPNSCVSVNQNTCGDDLEHQLWTGPCFGGWLAAQSQVKKYVKSHISANHRCVHCVQVNNINISRLQVHEPDRRTFWRRSSCLCLWQQNRMFLTRHPYKNGLFLKRVVEAVVKAERTGVTSMCPHTFGRASSKHKQYSALSSAALFAPSLCRAQCACFFCSVSGGLNSRCIPFFVICSCGFSEQMLS